MVNQYGAGGTMTVTMEGPYGSFGSLVKVGEIVLPADNWKNANSPFFQNITVDGVSINSKVDLQLTPEQIASVFSAGYCLTAVNDSGNVIVYAVGNKPASDITINATITEVVK
jgi:hypothetical protein